MHYFQTVSEFHDVIPLSLKLEKLHASTLFCNIAMGNI